MKKQDFAQQRQSAEKKARDFENVRRMAAVLEQDLQKKLRLVDEKKHEFEKVEVGCPLLNNSNGNDWPIENQ